MPTTYTAPHDWLGNAPETITAQLQQDVTNNIVHVKERSDRQVAFNDGTDAIAGDLLAPTAVGTDTVELSSSLGQLGPFAVALEALADGSTTGYARWTGTVLVNVASAVDVLDWLRASATDGKAEACLATDTGAFGLALSGSVGAGQVVVLLCPGVGGGGGGAVFSTSTDGLVPGPSGSEDDSSHVLAGDGSWLDTSTLGGGGSNATWDPYGNAVAPVASTFSVHDHWSGSGILTRLDQNTDNMVFYNPCAVSTIERGAFVPTSVPAPPYTVTACFVPNLVEIDYAAVALCLRDSSNDKRIILRVRHNTTLQIGDLYFDDYQTLTSGTGTPSGDLGWTQGFPIWLRFRDNASNLFYEYSRDGENWVIYQTKATGLHATMDQAGITMDSFTGGSGSAYAMTVLSFAVVNTA